jgi:biotin carboxyl carrier protein
MHYEVEVNGRLRKVVVQRKDGAFVVSVDGRQWMIDAARIDAQTLSLLIEGDPAQSGGPGPRSSHEVTLAPDPRTGALAVHVGEVPLVVSLNGRRRWGRTDESAPRGSGPERLTAPMPGKIARVLVKTGEAVSARQPVVVIEAMKMENELRASQAGTVAEIHVRDGQSVDAGALLAVIHR